MHAGADVLAESATMRRTAILLESLRREVEDAERGSGHRDRQLQHSSERAAATVSLRSMDASGGAGHEDHVIPSRAKLGGGGDFQLGVRDQNRFARYEAMYRVARRSSRKRCMLTSFTNARSKRDVKSVRIRDS